MKMNYFRKVRKMKSKKLLAILILAICGGQVAFAGTITGWGDNWSSKASPPSGSDFVSMAAGGHHGLALKADGSIEGWGWDYNGQATPPAGNDYVAIRGGLAHSIALKANGSIVGWGLNSYDQATPPAGSDYVAIAAGGWHSLAIKRDGSSTGWGSNGYGRATPPVGNDYSAIDAGGYHSLALKADGSIIAWGVSDGGAYDFGQVIDTPPGSDFIAIAAGWYHNIALKTDGSIVAWGINDGSADDYGQVTDTPTGNGFIAIAAGHWHNLALKADGTIIGWGRDNYNQTTPPAGKDFVAIGAGGDFSLVLTESVIGTGFIYQGRLIDADYPADDVYDFRFELYNDMTTGMQQGTTIYRDDVGFSDGYFTVGLDFGMNVIDSNALWLEIGVRPGDVNDPNLYTRLSPRQRITPTPYAVHASSSETVQTPLELNGSVAAPNSVLFVQNHHSAGIAISGKNVSTGYYGYLGTNTEGVHGWGGLAGVMGQSSSGRGLWGTAISGAGVYGEQFNSGNYGYLGTSDSGVYGYTDANSGYGVCGIASASGDVNTYGGYFKANGKYGPGVYGEATGSRGVGVYGWASKSGNYTNYGGFFFSSGEYGRGLKALASGSRGAGILSIASNPDSGEFNNHGGIFVAEGNKGIGVYGEAPHTGSVYNYGGYFKAAGDGGQAVYGEATATSLWANKGGYFISAGGHGRGVEGEATGSMGIGVLGIASNDDPNAPNSGGTFYSEGGQGYGVWASAKKYDFFAAGPGQDYGSISSVRWKSNIRLIDDPLDKILQLRGVYFDWDAEHGGEHDVGMIAEEVGKVLPEIVRYEEDGIYTSGMDYSKLTPLLVEAIKELKKENDLLKQRIEVLERNR